MLPKPAIVTLYSMDLALYSWVKAAAGAVLASEYMTPAHDTGPSCPAAISEWYNVASLVRDMDPFTGIICSWSLISTISSVKVK